ncbi:MAG: hypothetical protein N0C84_07725 [Candidatus Thiodiazotropha taylori]|uniref:Uncharacterized protein n=1 Tax=Candidatus Thiodiazotropha taylori TaxID=2792791 RepID=A0A9E4KD88_9GAMM|nr:hypothetical protein [Candidatus Thiodiazotropha taylori]MCW4256341.1 hypothetical protein [Candidatus Thiodiazotropha taylori]
MEELTHNLDLVEETVLDSLANRDDYVIFGGYAAMILVDVAHSNDIDIFVNDPGGVVEICEDLNSKDGWRMTKDEYISNIHLTVMERNGFTADIINGSSTGVLFIQTRHKINYKHWHLYVVDPAHLLLSKILQLSYPAQQKDKRQRDIIVVERLRSIVSPNAVEKALKTFSPYTWLATSTWL